MSMLNKKPYVTVIHKDAKKMLQFKPSTEYDNGEWEFILSEEELRIKMDIDNGLSFNKDNCFLKVDYLDKTPSMLGQVVEINNISLAIPSQEATKSSLISRYNQLPKQGVLNFNLAGKNFAEDFSYPIACYMGNNEANLTKMKQFIVNYDRNLKNFQESIGVFKSEGGTDVKWHSPFRTVILSAMDLHKISSDNSVKQRCEVFLADSIKNVICDETAHFSFSWDDFKSYMATSKHLPITTRDKEMKEWATNLIELIRHHIPDFKFDKNDKIGVCKTSDGTIYVDMNSNAWKRIRDEHKEQNLREAISQQLHFEVPEFIPDLCKAYNYFAKVIALAIRENIKTICDKFKNYLVEVYGSRSNKQKMKKYYNQEKKNMEEKNDDLAKVLAVARMMEKFRFNPCVELKLVTCAQTTEFVCYQMTDMNLSLVQPCIGCRMACLAHLLLSDIFALWGNAIKEVVTEKQ